MFQMGKKEMMFLFMDLLMNRLALGTAQFGLQYGIANQSGKISRSEAGAMLQLARNESIEIIETAIAYGERELCLGDLGVEGFKIVTKIPWVPTMPEGISDWVRSQILDSCSRLGVRSVYAVLLHQPTQLLESYGDILFKALQQLKEDAVTLKIGVSIYSPCELDMLVHKFRFDLVQAPLNLVDQRLVSSGWLRRLNEKGIEVHTRSTFLQGLLLMPRFKIPYKFDRWKNLWCSWHSWLEEHGIDPVQACLAYPLGFPEVDRVIVGADSLKQLQKIIDSSLRGELEKLPNLVIEDEQLINPINWTKL
jgi:aryl-alcohol dehydrogenase-like predicted oxidoreductase